MNAKNRLLLLADDVAGIDADLGSSQADAWLAAAIDAVTHALIDVADDAPSPTITTPVLDFPGDHGTDSPADRASCAAAATALRRAHASMTSLVASHDQTCLSATGTSDSGITHTNMAGTGIADDVSTALEMLANALQDVASEPGADRHQAVRAQAHRNVRAAYRLMQPHGNNASPLLSEDS